MVPYYPNSTGNANSLTGDGILSIKKTGKLNKFNTYKYDPANPVTSYGGNFCCYGIANQTGSFDQRALEMRNKYQFRKSNLILNMPELREYN